MAVEYGEFRVVVRERSHDELVEDDDNEAMHREYAKNGEAQKCDAVVVNANEGQSDDDFRATDVHADDPCDQSEDYVDLDRMTNEENVVRNVLDDGSFGDPLRCDDMDVLH